MQQVLLIDNPLDRSTWETVEVEDVRDFLIGRYAEWPPTARIYAGQVAEVNDVTPRTKEEVERLGTYERLAVVIYPENPLKLVAFVIGGLVALASFFLSPKIKTPNVQTSSPNNGLSERANTARPGARIPDIYGTVLSVPDLIAAPYRVYINHRQLEICYMCVGRGAYAIDADQVRDGDTLISSIEGASLSVYAPFDSPNGGDTPQLQIGTAIGDPVFNIARLNDVNGQTLKAPNDEAVRADAEIKFEDGGIIRAGPGIDFTDFFEPDDDIMLGNADGGAANAPFAKQAPAIAAMISGTQPGKLIFTGYDPSADWQIGQRVQLSNAVWITTSYPGGGDLSGGGDGGGPDNPNWPEVIFPDAPFE